MANLKEMIDDPSAHFKTPIEVVEDPALPKRLKKTILKKWERDAKAMQVATDEGMPGGEDDPLPEVSEAITELDQDEEKPASQTAPGTN